MGQAKNRPRTTEWGMVTILCVVTTLVLPPPTLYGPIHSILGYTVIVARICPILVTRTWLVNRLNTLSSTLMFSAFVSDEFSIKSRELPIKVHPRAGE